MDELKTPCLNMIVRKFGERHRQGLQGSYGYLSEFGGVDFLLKFYDIEHTLPVEDTLDELTLICQDHGGHLK